MIGSSYFRYLRIADLARHLFARASVVLDSGYSAYPLINPAVIADITGNGALSGLDANRIAQVAVGIDRREIPSIPTSNFQGPALDAVFAHMDTSVAGNLSATVSSLADDASKARRTELNGQDSRLLAIVPPTVVPSTVHDLLRPTRVAVTVHEELTDALFELLYDEAL